MGLTASSSRRFQSAFVCFEASKKFFHWCLPFVSQIDFNSSQISMGGTLIQSLRFANSLELVVSEMNTRRRSTFTRKVPEGCSGTTALPATRRENAC